MRNASRAHSAMLFAAVILAACSSGSSLHDPNEGDEETKDAGTKSDVPCGTGGKCNPKDLGGATCTSLGMGMGDLTCDPDTCMFDMTMCQGAGNTGTAASGGSAGATGGITRPRTGGTGGNSGAGGRMS